MKSAVSEEIKRLRLSKVGRRVDVGTIRWLSMAVTQKQFPIIIIE
jgi:hypothetical protein